MFVDEIINSLPTETDPFSSPDESRLRKFQDNTPPASPSTGFLPSDVADLLPELPPHVKFPHTFRERASTLYKKHSKKLPRSVRLYRQTFIDHSTKTISTKKVKLQDEQHVEDITLDFFYKPKTITTLLILITVMCYFGLCVDADGADIRSNIIRGASACSFLFIVLFGILAFPNGPFIRPHPAVWRVVLCLSVMYLLLLTFILFLSMDQIKYLLFFVDPSLKYAKREIDVVEEYAQDCWNITPGKILNSLDIFAFAHALGWVGKAVLLRSYGLCWLISILWELTEIVFYHILPNFAECFWDSWILDVCICNGGGIWLGIKIAEFLEVRKYKWESIKDIDSVSGKLRRAAMQFSPHSWFAVSWIDPQSSPHRVFKLWILTMLFLVVELNTFFFKHFFVFDSNHFLCWGRITFICLIAAPSIRQYYVYTTDMTAKRLGIQCWVFISVACMETLVNIKFGWNTLTNAQLSPLLFWIFFSAVACAISLYCMAALSELQSFIVQNQKPDSKTNTPTRLLSKESDTRDNIHSLSTGEYDESSEYTTDVEPKSYSISEFRQRLRQKKEWLYKLFKGD